MFSRGPDDGDDMLLAELMEALADPGPIPQRVVDAAKEAFAWRIMDAELELMTLVYDSRLEDGAVVRNGAAAPPRTLVFEGSDICVEVEVGDDVMGQIIPPQPGHVTLVTPQETFAAVEADAMGCFRLERPAHGPVRFSCETLGSRLTTDWMPL